MFRPLHYPFTLCGLRCFVGRGDYEECIGFYVIIYLFCATYGMEISSDKSVFYKIYSSATISPLMSRHFPFKGGDLDASFKYLCIILNPNNYSSKDWGWLLKKVEKRIRNQAFRFLSL